MGALDAEKFLAAKEMDEKTTVDGLHPPMTGVRL
jgi:hypothetical protein